MTRPEPFKRKTIKHYEFPSRPRCFTFSTYEMLPLLEDEQHCRIVAEAIHRAVIRHHFILLAWVLMPDHVHVVGVPWEDFSGASKFLYAIKRPSSYRIKQVLVASRSPLLARLTIRERPKKMAFRFWQEGPGHDRTIRVHEGLNDAINYVHLNPVKRGLCDEPEGWYWSSARQQAQRSDAPALPLTVRLTSGGRFVWDGADVWFAGDQAR
jgi:putative transposase